MEKFRYLYEKGTENSKINSAEVPASKKSYYFLTSLVMGYWYLRGNETFAPSTVRAGPIGTYGDSGDMFPPTYVRYIIPIPLSICTGFFQSSSPKFLG